MDQSQINDRVVAYVDGFNLYFGMRQLRLQQFYWLNVPKAIERLLEREERLIATKYFTSRVSGPPDKVQRQSEYLEALETVPNLSMIFGMYNTQTRKCSACQSEWEQHSEKMTDVNIAVEMLTDAHRDVFDTAVVVSADADLAPAFQAIRMLYPNKRVLAMFPPGRGSVKLESIVHGKRRMRQWVIAASQLPDTVIGRDGYPKKRPKEWMLPGP